MNIILTFISAVVLIPIVIALILLTVYILWLGIGLVVGVYVAIILCIYHKDLHWFDYYMDFLETKWPRVP